MAGSHLVKTKANHVGKRITLIRPAILWQLNSCYAAATDAPRHHHWL